MSQHSTGDQSKLGFLAFKEFERGYRGGLLITDNRGTPLEFRCTSPIRPNQVQRILYGRSLVSHLAVNLIGAPLTGSVTEKPTIIIVNQDPFLQLRELIQRPVIFVRRQGETFQAGGDAQDRPDHEPFLLECEGAKFAPIIVESHWRYSQDTQQIRQQLREIFDYVDLLEPFERVDLALDEVERQKAVDS